MHKNNSNPRISAALIIIGDEILSGQINDQNIATIASFCTKRGIDLKEVRVVADEESEIIAALNDLRPKYTYIFSTGGIGPTHDDVTADAVAKAFGVELEINPKAREMLQEYSNSKNISSARLRMARIPKGAKLIKNGVTGAPGFQIENVYVMAGVPVIMKSMLEDIAVTLRGGEKIISKKILCALGESMVASSLKNIQNEFENVKIGSYPQMGKFSAIILRSIDKIALEQAAKLVQIMIDKLHEENNIILPLGEENESIE